MKPGAPRVLLIGAGRISAAFDSPGQAKILTHAHAWKLLGADLTFHDPDPVRLASAVAKWGGSGSTDLAEALEPGPWDAVVLAAPDEFHLPIAKRLAGSPWKTLVLEKPPATSRGDWMALQEILGARTDDVAVNFTRRWAPGLIRLREEIRAGSWGELLHGHAMYGNGLLHNGSHLTDFLTWILGPLAIEGLQEVLPDRSGDPSAAFRLRTCAGRPIDVAVVDCSRYTVFEVDLFFSRGRIRLPCSAGTVESTRVVPSEDHAGFRVLGGPGTASSELDTSLLRLARAVEEHSRLGTPLDGTLEEIADGFDLCLRLQEMRDATP
jgi:predicted dehydrogenase